MNVVNEAVGRPMIAVDRPSDLPTLDLASVPWSRYGSYMTISTKVAAHEHPGRTAIVKPGAYVFDVSGRRLFRWNGVFRIECLVAGSVVDVRVLTADPMRLVLVPSDAGLGETTRSIEATWDGPDAIRFRGHGLGMRLTQTVLDPLESAIAFPRDAREWRLQMGEDAHYAVTALHGDIAVEAPRVRSGAALDAPDRKVVDLRPGSDGRFEAALVQYESGWLAPAGWRSFDACLAETAEAYRTWRDAQPTMPPSFMDARALAAYITWSGMVAARGNMTRPSMVMSKNWMFAVWSWDHCFNAVGSAPAHPDVAWDQLMLLFDQQHPQGALPDIVSDASRMWGFLKPPVHGWALRRLDQAGLVTDERLAEIYPRLVAWTDWWTTYRNVDGLCEYYHGNDSGWDNATAFDMGFPALSPDLGAFLVVQMDVLADAAVRLGRGEDATAWRRRADDMAVKLVDRLWDGERFVARRSDDGTVNPDSRSLIPFMPLLLGDRLSANHRQALITGLRASGNLTAHGPATESPSGPLYQTDGYWRGPIWAPTTLLLVDGLAACGEHELAADTARRFARMCRISGFAENYDPVSGAPLRDTSYTWSASVFLALAPYLRGGA